MTVSAAIVVPAFCNVGRGARFMTDPQTVVVMAPMVGRDLSDVDAGGL
jgi:hypothetical protein